MINAAIVGLGWWGKQIVGAVQNKSDRIRFVRGVTKEPDEVRAFAAGHDLALSVDYEDVIADDRIDAVVLATPHSLHTAQIIRAASVGKHVFCDKPFTLRRADAERAVEACRKAGVAVAVGHNRRLWPAIVEIKAMVERGELGTILHVEGNYSHDWLADIPPGGWRTDPDETPAGGMTGMGIHLTDSYRHLVGPIKRVQGQCVDRVLGRPSGDTVSVLLEFDGGATGYLGTMLATSYIWRLQLYGSAGWVESRGETDLTICRRGEDAETIALPALDSVHAEMEAFATAAENGTGYHIPPDEIIHNVAVFEAIVSSVASGHAETIGHR